jgi:SRSO17 transposase
VLDRAKWDEDAVRDVLRASVDEALADPQAFLILDETGFLKSAAWVTGHTVYGGNPQLRAELETRQQAYALAISYQERVDVSGKRVRVDDLIQEAAQEEWCRLSAGLGAKLVIVRYIWQELSSIERKKMQPSEIPGSFLHTYVAKSL